MTLPDPTNFGHQPGDGPLRPGGVPMSLPQTEDNLPSTRSTAAGAQRGDLVIVRDLWGGTTTVRSKGTAYLPQAPGEQGVSYSDRLARSMFHNFFRRTIEGLVGMIYAKDPVLGTDVPAKIREQWENIDNAGTHGDVFLRQITTDAETTGHAAILVEFPHTDGTQLPDAEARDIRPYWVPITKDQLLSWRTTNEDGRVILTQVVIEERSMVSVGRFGEKEQVRYRVLYRENGVTGFVVLEVTEAKEVRIVDQGTYPTQPEIPLAEIVTSGHKGVFDSDPPLMDVAWLNIAHYQQWSDYATAIHKTNVPIYAEFGVDIRVEPGQAPAEVVLGPNTVRQFPNADAHAEYISHGGGSLASSKAALDDIKADIGALGLAMLAPQKRSAETAEAKRIDEKGSDSAVAVTSRGVQDGAEQALLFHARYMGLDDGGSITINRDFEQIRLGADVVQAYAVLVERMGLPPRVAIKALKKGGWVAEDEDEETLAGEMLAGLAARLQDQEDRRAEFLAGVG